MNSNDQDNTANTPQTPVVTKPTTSKTASDIAPKAATPEEKRDALRAKIEASERRISERTMSDQAKDAAITAKDYTREHPLTVIGGALAFGLVIGLLTRPGRRMVRDAAIGTAGLVGVSSSETKAEAKDAGRTTKRKASRLGDIVTDALAVYSAKLIDGASEGARASQDALEDFGDNAAAKARKLRREADYFAGTKADDARILTRRARRRAGRTVRDIKGR